ncbi:hypothetical protein D3C76_1103430 [compost metagenome]
MLQEGHCLGVVEVFEDPQRVHQLDLAFAQFLYQFIAVDQAVFQIALQYRHLLPDSQPFGSGHFLCPAQGDGIVIHQG